MQSKQLFYTFSTLVLLLFSACNNETQTTKQISTEKSDDRIEVIQFHSEHRCKTCNQIEAYTKETLEQYFSDMPFRLINVDLKENYDIAEEFEATGTALIIHDPINDEYIDLTDFAFMNAGNKEKFIAGLRKEISQFGD